MYGGFNIHFLISFDDGLRWLLRTRRNRGAKVPTEISSAIIESEVATTQLLKAKVSSPLLLEILPELTYHADPSKDLPFDHSYCEYLEGTPYDVFNGNLLGKIELPEDELNHFIDEYAKIQIRLSKIQLPYTKIGCIRFDKDDENNTKVGPLINRNCLMKPNSPHFMGPFSTNKERYLALIDTALHLISLNVLKGKQPVDNYLWHLEMRELVNASRVLNDKPKELFIKHDDAKGDHMLMNEDGEITGIIDWEWAYVTTKAEAFTPHWIFNFVYGGPNTLTSNEHKLMMAYNRYDRPDLAECVKNGRL
ncbi:uncharacterized protein I206_102290 [Kwoniella pini CBS 10737]|uniref:Aminoglycoside phosphotransferase domain-containing protein n=1 Tax=Kwoniella pini CBS 10737 TaxID=1296096 RepID=A0A1B9HT29_9TREE|nr:uncharacterized protein I206_07660 [Kwoniella pini CBS 10737]OCF46426.1 hypothetical protein I206_07660 [Kwoniella pini CBS 10737]